MDKVSYHRHRYPSIVIQQAIWLYFRFALSYRDVEDMLAERGIEVSYETVRRWALGAGGLGLMHTRAAAPLSPRLQVPLNICHKPGELLRLVPKDVELGLRVGGLYVKHIRQGRCIR